MKRGISITIDENVLEELNKRRGLVPLSRFIEEMLKRELRKGG